MHLQKRALLVAVLMAGGITTTAGTRTATSAERAACEARIQPRLDAIESRLRAGYRAREGESLKQKRRKLEAERAACGKVSEPAGYS